MSMLYPTTGRKNDVFSGFDNVFNDFFISGQKPLRAQKIKNYSYVTTPKANVTRIDEGYRLDLAAPGFSKEEFDINIEENILTIGINGEDTHEYIDSLVRREYSYVTFSRAWTLPDTTDTQNIIARYEAGILSLHIPVERDSRVSTKINVE